MSTIAKNIADSETFQSFILFVILLTAFSMGLETVPELVDTYFVLFETFFYVTQIIFAFEIFVRVLAFSPHFRRFFDDFWNTFDFTIVVLSFIPGIGSFIIIGRLLRLLRILRVLSVSDRLRNFVNRLEDAFDEALFGGLVLIVLGYIFTIAGNYLFFEIDPQRWGSFGRSALSVFYLLLFQDIPRFIEPVVALSKLYIFYFLFFYFVVIGLFISVLNAAISQERTE